MFRIKTRQELIARRDFIDKILDNEDAIDVDTIPTNTIAVYDFDGSSLGPELAPLAVGLAAIFVKKQYVNPKVKALLRGLDPIDCRELAEELQDFAQDIGATRSRN